ncbi:MAG: heterodisulfide reductase subunit C [Aquifex sp.]|nr:MAG: heterodisulfide reductase subunit C [Aquifex sp.]
MAIHERSLVEPERILRKDRLVIDGIDVSGDWNLIILPRVIEDYDLSLLEEVLQQPEGKTILQCYQCSYCTASCPVHNYWDERYNPRHFIHLARLGLVDELQKRADVMWRCVSCHKCTHRCPKGVLVEEVLKAILKVLAKRGLIEEYPSKKFDKFFLEQVYEYGRIEDGDLLFGWIEKQGYKVFKDPILKKPIPLFGEIPEWLKTLAVKPIKNLNIDFLILNAKHMLIHPRTKNWSKMKQVLKKVFEEEGVTLH